jgi:cell division protein FtsW
LEKNQQSKEELKKAFFIIMGHTAVVCGLIFITNFSTAALLFATIFTMLYVGRIPFRFLFLVVALGIGMVASTYVMAKYIPASPTRVHTVKGRIDRFIYGDPNSEKGITQADYAKLAIYEGGILGKGPGRSDVSNYMAAAYNDFIFAIIVEEYG